MAALRNLMSKMWNYGSHFHTAVDIASGIVGKADKVKSFKEGVETIKGLASGKGLQDQYVWGMVLQQCHLSTEQRRLLIESIEEMRLMGNEEAELADNFIIAVALGEPINGSYPGKEILNGFIHRVDEFPDDASRKRMIKDNIRSIGNDATVKGVASKVKKLVKTYWPKLDQEAANVVDGFNEQLKKLYKL
ncbi:MAG: hypothetical protein U5L10_05450 [Candidatus Moranbacteria bacterium]|nr:hypothetical protein [Candidatus Moranbacteria bacterium]